MKSLENLPHKKPIDVLLVNPGNLSSVYQELGSHFSAIEPPSLAALFATYLVLKEVSVDIIDAPAFNLSPQEVARLIYRHFDPKLIVLVVYGFQPSASTQNMAAASEIARELNKINTDFKVMMTGTHPAALPSRTYIEEAVDYVASGEGPITIYETVLHLRGELPIKEVRGLIHETGNNAPAPLIDDLDLEMPYAMWELLPMDRYRAHNWHCFEDIANRMPYASIHTSLGCPFKCSFCCINAPFGKPSYRMWSPESVVRELETLHNKYGVKNIKFVDEMFVLNKEHVLKICELLIKANLDLNIWAYARIDTVRPEFLEPLKKAGFRWLALGIESGSKHVRDGVEKGRFGSKEILDTVKRVQDAGINVIGNYIFGLPDDTYESMNETLDLAITANCEFANFYSAMAYPGSKLFASADAGDLPATWLGYSQHSYESTPLPTKTLTSAQVLKFRDNAFYTYFKNPKYLSLVKEKFGMRAHQNILDMTAVKLKRKLYQ